MNEFAKWCAKRFGVSERVWFSSGRAPSLVNQRRVSMAAAGKIFQESPRKIGLAFKRNHSRTAIKAIDVCRKDPVMGHCVDLLVKEFTQSEAFTGQAKTDVSAK